MCVAVFVDAGYLYGGGLKAITGSSQIRESGQLNLSEIVAKLRAAADDRSGNVRLLRIYWYDGMLRGRPSPEQEALANMDDIKLRLGVVRDGRQKGVDSLIVTDLIELARNHAISDAVLLAGDEDLRIGVQIAQSFGVRVHLIGIEPSSANQSPLLVQEADTTREWRKADISAFLDFNPNAAQFTTTDTAQIPESTSTVLDNIVEAFLTGLESEQLNDIAALPPTAHVPRNYDAPLLASSGEKIGRDLEEPERRYIRRRVKEQAAIKVATPASG